MPSVIASDSTPNDPASTVSFDAGWHMVRRLIQMIRRPAANAGASHEIVPLANPAETPWYDDPGSSRGF